MKRFFPIAIFLVLIVFSSAAQNKLSFKTEELKRVAVELELDSLDTLKTGNTVMQKDKYQLVVRKADNGVIEHVGISLFPESYRLQANGAVIDFLEIGLLCNTYKLTKNQLKYMDAKFVKGNWSQMLTLSTTASCSIAMVNNKAYQVVWKEDNAEKINLLIPIKYDFLANAPRKELEYNFIRDLKAYKAKRIAKECNTDVAKLKIVKDGADTLYISSGKHYLIESITNATYYKLEDSLDYVPIIDVKFPVQTVANTLLLGCKKIPMAKIVLTVVCSDKKNTTVIVPVRHLVEFAESIGCVPYFSYEEMKDGKLLGGLFLYNKKLGYDHVLSLSCDIKDIATDKLVFTSYAYLYTPTTNVKNLYGDIKSKR